jgi:hypothetical protein
LIFKTKGIIFKASEHIRAKIITDKEVAEQIKELTTWDVGHHIKIKIHKVTYWGVGWGVNAHTFCVCVCKNLMHI